MCLLDVRTFEQDNFSKANRWAKTKGLICCLSDTLLKARVLISLILVDNKEDLSLRFYYGIYEYNLTYFLIKMPSSLNLK